MQDTVESDVWQTWGVAYRDIWVLDGENRLIAVFNVTQQSLADAANYDELRGILIGAAAP